MNASDQTLAACAAKYFEARDKAQKEDRLRRQREKDACPKGDEFTFNGETVFSLAHMETMRPREPMTPDELQDAIERLRRGNALLIEEFPAKLSAFEQAMQRAQTHFAARDEARAAAGIPAAADEDDDPRWTAIEAMEIGAWSAPVSTLGDITGLLRLLQDHVETMGIGDCVIESRLPDRLGEAITLLSGRQQ